MANENFFKAFRFTRNLNNLIKPNNSSYIMYQSGRVCSKTVWFYCNSVSVISKRNEILICCPFQWDAREIYFGHSECPVSEFRIPVQSHVLVDHCKRWQYHRVSPDVDCASFGVLLCLIFEAPHSGAIPCAMKGWNSISTYKSEKHPWKSIFLLVLRCACLIDSHQWKSSIKLLLNHMKFASVF